MDYGIPLGPFLHVGRRQRATQFPSVRRILVAPTFDVSLLSRNLWVFRKGVVAGPSGLSA